MRRDPITSKFENAARIIVSKMERTGKGMGMATLYRDSQFEFEAREITDIVVRSAARSAFNRSFEAAAAAKYPNHARTLLRQKGEEDGV